MLELQVKYAVGSFLPSISINVLVLGPLQNLFCRGCPVYLMLMSLMMFAHHLG